MTAPDDNIAGIAGTSKERVLMALQLLAECESRRARLRPLSERERDVCACLCRGMTNPQIGKAVGLSKHTINDHLKAIFFKLGVHTRTEVAVLFARAGLAS